MYDPQQELFTAIRMALDGSPYDVYDGALPPDGTPYPFIYLAETMLNDDIRKNGVVGNVTQTIHIYSNDVRKRGTASLMAFAVKNLCRHIQHTTNFSWDLISVRQQHLSDNTTDEPLLHIVIDVEYRFS